MCQRGCVSAARAAGGGSVALGDGAVGVREEGESEGVLGARLRGRGRGGGNTSGWSPTESPKRRGDGSGQLLRHI